MSLTTYVKDHQPKVHFSEYLKTENTSGEDEKAKETTQPATPEAA